MRARARPVVIQIEGALEIVAEAVFEFRTGFEPLKGFPRMAGRPGKLLLDLLFAFGFDVGRIGKGEGPVVGPGALR